jgi:hypothetical protein
VDFNNDGKKDVLAGDTKGQVWMFLNTGTDAAPVLAEGVRLESNGNTIVGSSSDKAGVMGVYSKLHYADFNGDGLDDILIGHTAGSGHDIVMYKNIGTKSAPKFDKPVPVDLAGLKVSRPSPYVFDWDGDGKLDLLLGTEKAAVYICRNVGTNKEPKLEKGKKLDLVGDGFDKSYRCRIDVADYNSDGKSDIIVGNFFSSQKPMGGNVWVFLRK